MNNNQVQSAKDLALSELNLNYKKYLEKQLFENVLLEIVNSNRALVDDNYKSIAKYDELLLDRYIKSCVNAEHEEDTGEQRLPALDSELKNYFLNKFESILESRVDVLNELTTNDLDLLTREVDMLVNDTEYKTDLCMNVTFEVSDLIKELLARFRLEFYAKENELTYEHMLVQFDTLCAKVRVVTAELMDELYSREKLNALGVIRNQIDLNTKIAKDKLGQLVELSESYKALGSEFEDLVKLYKQRKEQLARKQYSINKLNSKRNDF